MLNVNREQLKKSAETKSRAAVQLNAGNRKHPTPAVYLAHVALECALKRRILIANKARHVDDLKRRLDPATVDDLFSGKRGHDLHHLQETASLKRYLEASGEKSLLSQPEWHAFGNDRPYSLRYGSEVVSAGDAEAQVKFAANLTDLMLMEVG
jgi:hypothetical protein